MKLVRFIVATLVIGAIAGMAISTYGMLTVDGADDLRLTHAIPTVIIQDTPSANPMVSSRQLMDPLALRHSSDAPRYVRAHWATAWSDLDGDCHDTRAEVLIEESRDTVRFSDTNPCRVVAGRWLTPWTGTLTRDALDVQIDHHVPVADAHRSGGHRWSAQQRERFYNDPTNLNALPSDINQQKSAHTPDRWHPASRSAWCGYATQWVDIKAKYRLSATPSEKRALAQMLDAC